MAKKPTPPKATPSTSITGPDLGSQPSAGAAPRLAGPGLSGPAGSGIAHERGPHAPGSMAGPIPPSETLAFREIFWQNVIREVLVSMIAAQAEHNAGPAEQETAPETAQQEMFDGRMGLITTQGQRIPIGRIYPVFAASMGPTPAVMELSTILQCTVFQVHTPAGEVYTLPLHEVRGFHALAEALMAQLEARAARRPGKRARDAGEPDEPFGFAAFTSTARGRERSGQDADQGPSGAD